jgi:RNA polymerase sigma-70 factor (ECF subfamily)
VGYFREHSQFSTWLIRITVNQALMKLRKRRTTKEVSLDEDFQADGDMLPREVVDWAPNPEELYRVSELRDILIKALENLRPALRTVFVLRDIEGLSIHQTAEVLELSPAAVKARLLRARLQLRELLNEYFRKTTNMRGSHLGRAQSCVARFPRQDVSPLKLPHGLK